MVCLGDKVKGLSICQLKILITNDHHIPARNWRVFLPELKTSESFCDLDVHEIMDQLKANLLRQGQGQLTLCTKLARLGISNSGGAQNTPKQYSRRRHEDDPLFFTSTCFAIKVSEALRYSSNVLKLCFHHCSRWPQKMLYFYDIVGLMCGHACAHARCTLSCSSP